MRQARNRRSDFVNEDARRLPPMDRRKLIRAATRPYNHGGVVRRVPSRGTHRAN